MNNLIKLVKGFKIRIFNGIITEIVKIKKIKNKKITLDHQKIQYLQKNILWYNVVVAKNDTILLKEAMRREGG